MSYPRVIPRDLFNEANLLKCYGRIYLELERLPNVGAELLFPGEGTGEAFVVEQDEADGSIYLANVHFMIRGTSYPMRRPLNSRDNYPLYITLDDYQDPIRVFNELGHFSQEMRAFLLDGQDTD